jgi:hypothetical protein
MPQHQRLCCLGGIAPGKEGQPAEHPSHDQIEQPNCQNRSCDSQPKPHLTARGSGLGTVQATPSAPGARAGRVTALKTACSSRPGSSRAGTGRGQRNAAGQPGLCGPRRAGCG